MEDRWLQTVGAERARAETQSKGLAKKKTGWDDDEDDIPAPPPKKQRMNESENVESNNNNAPIGFRPPPKKDPRVRGTGANTTPLGAKLPQRNSNWGDDDLPPIATTPTAAEQKCAQFVADADRHPDLPIDPIPTPPSTGRKPCCRCRDEKHEPAQHFHMFCHCVPENSDNDDLLKRCEEFGPVQRANVVNKRDGSGKMGHVNFSTIEGLFAALKGLRNDSEYSVKFCRSCEEALKGIQDFEMPARFGKGPRTCRKCDQEGHIARDCPNSTQSGDSRACFKCGQEGHSARDCSAPRRCCRCPVSEAHDPAAHYHVFCGEVPEGTTEEEFRAKCGRGVTECVVFTSKSGQTMGKAFFTAKDDADYAVRRLRREDGYRAKFCNQCADVLASL